MRINIINIRANPRIYKEIFIILLIINDWHFINAIIYSDNFTVLNYKFHDINNLVIGVVRIQRYKKVKSQNKDAINNATKRLIQKLKQKSHDTILDNMRGAYIANFSLTPETVANKMMNADVRDAAITINTHTAI